MGCNKHCKCPKRKNILVVASHPNEEEFPKFAAELSTQIKEKTALSIVELDEEGRWINMARRKARVARNKGYKKVSLITLDTSADFAAQMVQLSLCYDAMYSGTTVKEVLDSADISTHYL